MIDAGTLRRDAEKIDARNQKLLAKGGKPREYATAISATESMISRLDSAVDALDENGEARTAALEAGDVDALVRADGESEQLLALMEVAIHRLHALRRAQAVARIEDAGREAPQIIRRLPGRLKELHTAWAAFLEVRREVEREVSYLREIRQELTRARLPAPAMTEEQFQEVASLFEECGIWSGDRGKGGLTIAARYARGALVEHADR
jgi:hypothetical protein